MTPSQIETAARHMYNSINSNFFSQEEILYYIYFAEMDLARRALVLDNTYSATTVASTRDYAKPVNSFIIRKVTFDGVSLEKIDMKEDDLVTGYDEDTTSSGDPRYYYEWEDTIILRPIPSSAKTLKIWTYDIPSIPTITSTLEVNPSYHADIVLYCLAMMVTKDEKYSLADRYLAKWEQCIAQAKRDVAKKKRGDKLAAVKDEESVMNFDIIEAR